MTFKNFTKLATATATVLALSPMAVLADGAQETTIDLKPTTGIANKISAFRAQDFMRLGINLILIGGGIITFFFLLIGGVQWIMAGGDKEGTEKARKRITSALVGLAIVFSAYAITFLIESIFGVSIINFTIPTIGGQG